MLGNWHRPLDVAYKTGRKIIVTVIGFTVVLFGIVLVFTPGPALVFIPLGLAILGLEFTWARRWVLYLKNRSKSVGQKFQKKEEL